LLLAGFFDQFLFLKKQWKSHQLLPLYPSFQNDPYCWNPVASVRFQSTAYSLSTSVSLSLSLSLSLFSLSVCLSLSLSRPQLASKQKKKRTHYASIRLHYRPWTCWQLSLSASTELKWQLEASESPWWEAKVARAQVLVDVTDTPVFLNYLMK
jgi:hypothetical protein